MPGVPKPLVERMVGMACDKICFPGGMLEKLSSGVLRKNNGGFH